MNPFDVYCDEIPRASKNNPFLKRSDESLSLRASRLHEDMKMYERRMRAQWRPSDLLLRIPRGLDTERRHSRTTVHGRPWEGTQQALFSQSQCTSRRVSVIAQSEELKDLAQDEEVAVLKEQHTMLKAEVDDLKQRLQLLEQPFTLSTESRDASSLLWNTTE